MSAADNASLVADANLVSGAVGVWIGASDQGTAGEWRWPDGDAVLVEVLQAWAPGRPNGATSANCLAVMLDDAAAVTDRTQPRGSNLNHRDIRVVLPPR